MAKNSVINFLLRAYHFNQYVFVFTLFTALSIICLWLDQQDLTLTWFKDHLVGRATFEQVDISKRVILYYQAIGLILAIFVGLYPVLITIKARLPDGHSLFYYIGNASLVGVFMVFFILMEVTNPIMIDLVWIVIVTVLLFSGFSYLNNYPIKNHHSFFWLTGLTLAITFLVREVILVTTLFDSDILHFHFLFLLMAPAVLAFITISRKFWDFSL